MSDWEDRGGGGRGGRGGGRGRGRGRGGGGDRDDSSGAGGGQGGASAGRGGSRAKIGGLTYTPAKTPSFLKAFQAQLAGAPPPGSKDPYSASDGRAALPGREGRQTSEEREEQERLEGDEFGWGEGGDDAPQVVVLKEGKHLTLEEMEDERRKAKGLPPIDRNPAPARKDASATSSSSASKGVLSVAAPKTGKRKAVAVGSDGPASKDGAPTDKKKQKKEKKGLLSFDEEG